MRQLRLKSPEMLKLLERFSVSGEGPTCLNSYQHRHFSFNNIPTDNFGNQRYDELCPHSD
jgi:hypothetical protein